MCLMKVRMSVEQSNIDVFISNIISKYHFLEADRDKLKSLYMQLKNYLGPYAAYRINQRVTGVDVIDEGPAAIVAMTLGAGVDRLQERYIKNEQLEEAYMIDCICAELLLKMYGEFNAAYARFHRRYVKRYVFVGDEISVKEIPVLLKDIKGDRKKDNNAEHDNREEVAKEIIEKNEECEKLMEHEDITCNEYGVLKPAKSVVFYAALSENPNQICEGICSNCGNAECENRVVASARVDTDDKMDNKRLNYGYQRIFGVQ